MNSKLLITPNSTNGFLSLSDFYALSDEYIDALEHDNNGIQKIRNIIEIFNESKRQGSDVFLDANPFGFRYTLYITNHFQQTYYLSDRTSNHTIIIESFFNTTITYYHGDLKEKTLLFSDRYQSSFYFYPKEYVYDNPCYLNLFNCMKVDSLKYIHPWF